MSRSKTDSPTKDATRWFLLAQLAESVDRCARAEAEAEVARKVRDDAIRRARVQGLSLTEIATLVGVTRQRIQQVAPGEEAEALAEGDIPAEVVAASS